MDLNGQVTRLLAQRETMLALVMLQIVLKNLLMNILIRRMILKGI